MKMIQINWTRFTALLSSRIIMDAIVPLDSEERTNVLIIDDSMFERNRSKKVELLAKAYDHAKHCYKFGFRMLAVEKGTIAMLELLKSDKKADIPAKYVLSDSWFSSPGSLHAVNKTGYDVIAMIKKTPIMFRTLLADQIDISDEKIDELVDAFMDAIPALLKSKLHAA